MELFGFICLTLILTFFSAGWVAILLFDGAFGGGKREVSISYMIILLAIIIYGWVKISGLAPFTVTLNL